MHARSRGGDQHHVEARLAQQRPEIHRHRLGVAGQEGRSEQEPRAGQDDRPERIDVLQRIEAYAPELPRRVISAQVRDEP
jgi:hypothetical protein